MYRFYVSDPDGRWLSETDTLAAARRACKQHEEDGETLPLAIHVAGLRVTLATYLGDGKWRSSDLARRYH